MCPALVGVHWHGHRRSLWSLSPTLAVVFKSSCEPLSPLRRPLDWKVLDAALGLITGMAMRQGCGKPAACDKRQKAADDQSWLDSETVPLVGMALPMAPCPPPPLFPGPHPSKRPLRTPTSAVSSSFYNHGGYSECHSVGHLPPLLEVAVPNACALGSRTGDVFALGCGLRERASGGLRIFTDHCLPSVGFQNVRRKVCARVTGAPSSGLQWAHSENPLNARADANPNPQTHLTTDMPQAIAHKHTLKGSSEFAAV